MEYVCVTAAGFLLDCIVGDPQRLWHPVRSIGWLIIWLEGRLRRRFPADKRGELAAGGLLVLFVLLATGAVTAAVLLLARRIHPGLYYGVMTVMCCQILAAKSLWDESGKVCQALLAGDVEQARRAVSMIVGRDTAVLDQAGITRAAVETVAENASDGVVAPLCYLLLFGPLGGMLYKAVNTMDSMVGYQNEQYQYFGRAAARLDDLVNWIPARLTALFFIAAAYALPGFSGRDAWRIWRRDRRNHKSPNSAQSESACAGAMGLKLAGDAWYFGVLHKKPTIGDETRPIEAEDIRRAGRLMYGAAVLALAAGAGLRLGLWQLAGM